MGAGSSRRPWSSTSKTGYIAERGPGAEELVRRSAPLVKRKLSTLAEYDGLPGWLFRPLEIDPDAWEVLTQDVKHSIQVIGGGLAARGPAGVDPGRDQGRTAGLARIMGEAARDFLEPQRIAITGQRVSTGIYESLELLGREESSGATARRSAGSPSLGGRLMVPSRRTQRTIVLIGAVLGVFFLVAFGFRRAGISQEALDRRRRAGVRLPRGRRRDPRARAAPPRRR